MTLVNILKNQLSSIIFSSSSTSQKHQRQKHSFIKDNADEERLHITLFLPNLRLFPSTVRERFLVLQQVPLQLKTFVNHHPNPFIFH